MRVVPERSKFTVTMVVSMVMEVLGGHSSNSFTTIVLTYSYVIVGLELINLLVVCRASNGVEIARHRNLIGEIVTERQRVEI